MFIKMLTKLGKIRDEYSENFNKEIENKKVSNESHKAEEYNNWTVKCTKGFKSHLGEAEERKGELKDRAVKCPIRAQKEK